MMLIKFLVPTKSKVISTVILFLLGVLYSSFLSIFDPAFNTFILGGRLILLLFSYLISCLVFNNYRHLKLLYYVLFFIIAPILLIGAINLFKNLSFSMAEYCYDYDFGFVSFNGIPNKACDCEGRLINNCEIFSACDGGEVRCKGKIKGYVYRFGRFNFKTIEDLENSCQSIDDPKNKEYCFGTSKKLKLVEEMEKRCRIIMDTKVRNNCLKEQESISRLSSEELMCIEMVAEKRVECINEKVSTKLKELIEQCSQIGNEDKKETCINEVISSKNIEQIENHCYGLSTLAKEDCFKSLETHSKTSSELEAYKQRCTISAENTKQWCFEKLDRIKPSLKTLFLLKQ